MSVVVYFDERHWMLVVSVSSISSKFVFHVLCHGVDWSMVKWEPTGNTSTSSVSACVSI